MEYIRQLALPVICQQTADRRKTAQLWPTEPSLLLVNQRQERIVAKQVREPANPGAIQGGKGEELGGSCTCQDSIPLSWPRPAQGVSSDIDQS